MRRQNILFLAENAENSITGALLDEFKRKDWVKKKK